MRPVAQLLTDAAKAELRSQLSDGSVDDHHLDDQPAQPHAESAAELSDSIPTRLRAIAISQTLVWESSGAARVCLPPCLDGPRRPPDAS